MYSQFMMHGQKKHNKLTLKRKSKHKFYVK